MKKEIFLTIDRFEGRFAVCFDDEEREFNIERIALPDMKEGDCFLAELTEEKLAFVRALPEETARRRSEAEAMLSAIFSKNKGKR
jgi:hypothetical protein